MSWVWSIDKKRRDRESLIQTTIMDFENYVFPKYLDNYKVYLWFILDRAAEIEAWQSNVDYPLVAATVDTMFANLYDFGYKFNIDENKIREECNRSFDFRQCWKQTIASVWKEAILIWKAFCRDFFLKEPIEEEFFWEKIFTEIKRPTMEYISIFDVFYDRSYWIEKSPYTIIRTYTTWDDILSKGRRLWNRELNKCKTEEEREEKRKSIESLISNILTQAKHADTQPFSYYNCNNIKDLSNVSPLLLNKLRSWSKISWSYVNLPMRKLDDKSMENNIFLNKNKTTYEFVVYSDWEEVCYYVNWLILYEWKKEYNIWEIREIIFSEIPWSNNSQWIWDSLAGLQNIINWMWNAFLDNIKLQLSDMYEVVWNSPFVRNWKIDFKKFWALKVNTPNSIRRLELWVKDFTPINSIQLLVEFAQQRSWVNQYILWGQGRAERVSWGIDIIINQYKSKLTPITDSINRMMTNISRSWIMMLLKYYTEEELAKKEIFIEKKYDDKWKFITINVNWKDIKDIIDEDKISFSFDALYKVEMENNRNILKEMFQYVLQYAQDKVNLAAYFKALLWQPFTMDEIIIDKEMLDNLNNKTLKTNTPEVIETWATPEKVEQPYQENNNVLSPEEEAELNNLI